LAVVVLPSFSVSLRLVRGLVRLVSAQLITLSLQVAVVVDITMEVEVVLVVFVLELVKQ
jgi:hypothetical protein